MSRAFPRLRAAALVLCTVLAACGRADASGRQGKTDATPAATATTKGASATTDTLSDSAIVATADRGRVKGPDSAMWVVMISDFQCPYCKQWHDSSMKQVERDFIAPGKIRFAYLHLPLSSIHQHARAEAEAALCAGVKGKFWEYSESLFAAQPTVGSMTDVTPLLTRIATNLTLDPRAFAQCRASKAVAALVNNDIAQATQAGVTSTPSFIIGDFMVKGALPYKDFRQAVDTALAVRAKRKTP